MLPKINRITKKKDFDKIFKKGKGYSGDFLFLKIFKNNFSINRFGFIISQKVSKKSTIRNKIKRRLREIIKTNLPKIKKGFDIILIIKPNAEKESFRNFKDEVQKILKRAK